VHHDKVRLEEQFPAAIVTVHLSYFPWKATERCLEVFTGAFTLLDLG
jgi:hypothetical protein